MMRAGTASRLHLTALGLLLAALVAGLVLHGPELREDLRDGVERWRTNHPPPPAPAELHDALAGLTARLPAGVTPAVFAGGLVLKLDEDGMRGALVAPLIGDRSVPASEVLSSVHRAWQAGLREAGDALRMSPMRDEGGRVSAHLETGRGDDQISGEIAVVRAAPGYRLEAIWSPESDFNKDRAQLLDLVRAVRFTAGKAVRVEFGPHHAIAVPPGFVATGVPGGLELAARDDASVKLAFQAGEGHAGAVNPEALIEQFLARRGDLTDPTSGTTKSYPLTRRNEQAWDIAAREVDIVSGGQPVRTVITAGLTAGKDGQAYLLAARQAPRAAWTRHAFALALAESSALWLPRGPGGTAFTLPLSHVERTWELVEAWEIGRALRSGPQSWREALLPLALRASPRTKKMWALPVWHAQPDGTFVDPDNPLEPLVR
jgi:hypothetical protein